MIAVSTLSTVIVSAALVGSAPVMLPLPAISVDTACIVQNPRGLTERASPLDSTSFQVSGHLVKICYGRPSARGRTMIGGNAIPFGKLWRTGANEPTQIHTTVPLSIAGVEVEPGIYSLYTVPGQSEWQVIVNRSISQWGHEGRYSAEVEAQEVGRGSAPSKRIGDHVEKFTIRAESSGSGATVYLEWENTQVSIPLVMSDS